MNNDVFNRCLFEILEVDRTVFKARSNDGFVYMKRRQVDLGNYSYAMLFHLALHISKGKEFEGTQALFKAIAKRYGYLADKTTSEAALELKADVIEYMLQDCKKTGVLIAPDLVRERNKFIDLMRGWDMVQEDLFRCITEIGHGPPLCRELPQPRN